MNLGAAEATFENTSSALSWSQRVRDFVLLTKPRIVLLFALTGLAAMVLEGTILSDFPRAFWVFVGMVLTAGSANALNQYLDRDIDAVMPRTREKRPIPAGRMPAEHALYFAITIGLIATYLLLHFGSLPAAGIGVFTIAFYVGVYTLWLKRTTPYNIVIGGAAGATAPLIGWAAAQGQISFVSFALFMVIFMWTPAHFWALALCLREEYAEVNVPMLPVVAGVETTKRQIFLYTLATIPLTFVPYWFGLSGAVYAYSAGLLGLLFVYFAYKVWRDASNAKSHQWKMFAFSIVYLLVLFSALMVDVALKRS